MPGVTMSDYKDVIQRIIENTSLLPKHREELKVKRGFTDEVIDAMQFRSCGKQINGAAWYKEIPDNFQKSLSFENILIPYLNADAIPTHIRPHKFGVKGLGVQVYIPHKYIGDNTRRVVLAESEFKALASCLMGVPAIGIPGIASFSGVKFNILSEILKQVGVQEAVICFDMEEKGDPTLGNYKPDFKVRYDTEFYAYVMAQKLCNDGVKAKVATLDSRWMVDGKIDIDGILASNIAHDMYARRIDEAIEPSTYRMGLKIPQAHRSFLERRFDRYFYSGPVREIGGCYYSKKPGSKKLVEVSNFTIKVHHTVYDNNDKAERLCKFYSKYGNTSTAVLTPEVMVSKHAFQKFCYERGDLEFHGKDDDLQEIWRWVFMNQDGVGLKKLYSWGYNEEVDAWFFLNGAYKDDVFYPVGEDDIVWIGDDGYALPEYDVDSFAPPALSEAAPTDDISVKDIFDKTKDFIEDHHARLLIGWTLGNFFISDILKKYNVYPFLFMHGKLGSGKSTYANISSSFFGFKINGVAFSSTPVGIMTAAQKQCGPPIWIEEIRNSDNKMAEKINILRSIYDRSTRIKASRKAGEIKAASARSTLILSGEEYPKDAAFNSRCVHIPVFRDTDVSTDDESFNWVMEYKSMFNEIGHYILTNRKKLWAEIDERIDSYIESFDADKSISLTPRSKIHFSVLGSVADVLIGEDTEFSMKLAQEAVTHDSKVFEDQALYVFFDDLQNMSASGKLGAKILQNSYGKNADRLVNFAFNLAYSEWEHYYRGMRNDIPASKTALLEHLKREKYFKEIRKVRVNKIATTCAILEMNHAKFPPALKSIFKSQYHFGDVVSEASDDGGSDDTE